MGPGLGHIYFEVCSACSSLAFHFCSFRSGNSPQQLLDLTFVYSVPELGGMWGGAEAIPLVLLMWETEAQRGTFVLQVTERVRGERDQV